MNTPQIPSDGENLAGPGRLQERAFVIIFQSHTPAGRLFDVLLIIAILISIGAVALETVAAVQVRHGAWLKIVEWGFTLLFTIEYLVRLWCVRQPRVYATSFFGLVDLLAILPTYLALVISGSGYLLVVRILRTLRLFRILKLTRYVGAANTLTEALSRSRAKILVFLYTVMTLVIIFGTIMYLIEGPENGFTSIPKGIYWGVVTLTTVGFGDIAPHTPLGQTVAACVMILGYGIIAVPTGIYAAELRDTLMRRREQIACPECSRSGHDDDAGFCKFCGAQLKPEPETDA